MRGISLKIVAVPQVHCCTCRADDEAELRFRMRGIRVKIVAVSSRAQQCTVATAGLMMRLLG